MLLNFRSIIVLALVLQAFGGFSQARTAAAKWEPEDAEEHFKQHNYSMALPMFKELVKREPEYQLNLGEILPSKYVLHQQD